MNVKELRAKFPIEVVEFWEKNLSLGESITWTENSDIVGRDGTEGILVYAYKEELGNTWGRNLAFINKFDIIEYFWDERWIPSKNFEKIIKLKAFW